MWMLHERQRPGHIGKRFLWTRLFDISVLQCGGRHEDFQTTFRVVFLCICIVISELRVSWQEKPHIHSNYIFYLW